MLNAQFSESWGPHMEMLMPDYWSDNKVGVNQTMGRYFRQGVTGLPDSFNIQQ